MIYTYTTFKSDIIEYCRKSLEFNSNSDFNHLKNIEDIQIKVINSFNQSIINGNYACESDFLKTLKEFENEFNEAKTLIIDEFIQNFHLDHFYPILKINELSEILNSYIRFLENVNLKFNFHEKRFYFNESFYVSQSKLNFDKTNNSLTSVFYANLFIAQCDHFTSSSDNTSLIILDEIIDFLEIQLKLNNELDNELLDVLLSKAYFIRLKLTLRLVEEFKFNNKSSQIYVYKNSSHEIFNPNEILKESYFKNYKNWINYLLTHYEIRDNWNSDLSSNSNPIINLTDATILDLHKQIKYAKDVLNNHQLIVNVINELKNRLKNSKTSFDQYAYQICLSYAYNNEFSKLVQCENPDKNKIDILYSEIIECVEISNIKNYFVYALKLSYNIRILKSFFDQKTINENIDYCESLLNECEKLIRLYYSGIDWVRTNYNYIFQLPVNECFINHGENKVFVFSTCFLPISRNTLETKFKNDLESFYVYKASIENLLITYSGIKEIKELTKEFEKKETKALETIVIFSTIMTFVAASIPGFKFINTGNEAILFTISLGSSLALFAIVFYGLNRGMNKLKSLKYPLLFGAISSIIFWGLLFIYSQYNVEFKKYNYIKSQVKTIRNSTKNTISSIKNINIKKID